MPVLSYENSWPCYPPSAGFVATPQRLMRENFFCTRHIPLQLSPWQGVHVLLSVLKAQAVWLLKELCRLSQNCHTGVIYWVKVCSWAVNWIWSPEAGQTQWCWPIHYVNKTLFQEMLKYFISCGQGIDISKIIIRYNSKWEKEARLIALAASTW